MVARIVVGLLSSLLLVWCAVLLRDVHLDNRFTQVSGAPPGTQQFQRALELTQDARRLNADSTPQLNEASLYASSEPSRALRLALRIVKREPQNLVAWRLIADVAPSRDDALAKHARRRVHVLQPLG